MNDNFDNSNEMAVDETVNNNSKKRIMLNKWQTFGFLALIIAMVCGVSFASSRTTAKKMYVTALNGIAKQCRAAIEKIPETRESAGKLTVEQYAKSGTTGLYQADDSEEITEKYEVTFNGKKYFISTESFKALFDDENKKIFVRKVENGKEVGDVLGLKSDDEDDDYNYLSYDLLSRLHKYTSNAIDPMSTEDLTEQKNQMEAAAIMLETAAKNLKDSYFIDKKTKGINEYTLYMEKDEISEFIINVVKDLNKNTRFAELIGGKTMDSEELESTISDVKETVDELGDINLNISIFAKGNVKNFVGTKISFVCDYEDEKLEFLFDINSNGTKPLKDFDEFEGFMKLKAGDSNMDFKLNVSKTEVKITSNVEYTDVTYSYSSLEGHTEKVSSKLEFSVKADDGKELLKSISLTSKLEATTNGETHNIIVNIKGDSDKSMLESKRISVSMTADDEKQDDIIVLQSEDDKALKDSSKINLEMNIDGTTIVVTLEAKDKKALVDSSEVALLFGEKDNLMEVCTLIANDKKAIIKSSNVEFSLNKEVTGVDFTVGVKAQNKKELMKSSNLEIKFTGEVDSEKIDVVVTLKGDTEFKNAKKLEIGASGKISEVEFSMKASTESLENKAIKDSTKFKGSITAEAGENTISGNFNTEKGYEYSVNQKTEYSFSTVESRINVKFEKLNNVNFDKLMNTKNAVDTDEETIIKVIDPSYEPFDFDDWYNSYRTTIE